jgi:peptidase E
MSSLAIKPIYIYAHPEDISIEDKDFVHKTLIENEIAPSRVISLPDESYLKRELRIIKSMAALIIPGGHTFKIMTRLYELKQPLRNSINSGWNYLAGVYKMLACR